MDVVFVLVCWLTAWGAVACVARGYAPGQVALFSVLLGPLLGLGALSDKRRPCPQCQGRARPDAAYCGECGLQLQASRYWLARQQHAAQQGQGAPSSAGPWLPPPS